MKIKLNTRTGIPDFKTLDDADIEDALAIEFWMHGKVCPKCHCALPQSYKVLKKYWDAGKDAITFAGMEGIKTRAKRDLSDVKWAMLRGFIEALAIPERLVDRVNQFFKEQLEEKKQIMEDNYNEGTNDAI